MSPKPSSDPVAQQFASCTDANQCFWHLLNTVARELSVQAGTFFEWDRQANALRVAHTYGVLPWRIAQSEFPLDKGICGWVAQHLEAAIVNDVREDARFNNQVDLMTQFKTVSVLCVPVVAGKTLYGVLELINRQNHPFNEADLQKAHEFIKGATERAQSF